MREVDLVGSNIVDSGSLEEAAGLVAAAAVDSSLPSLLSTDCCSLDLGACILMTAVDISG